MHLGFNNFPALITLRHIFHVSAILLPRSCTCNAFHRINCCTHHLSKRISEGFCGDLAVWATFSWTWCMLPTNLSLFSRSRGGKRLAKSARPRNVESTLVVNKCCGNDTSGYIYSYPCYQWHISPFYYNAVRIQVIEKKSPGGGLIPDTSPYDILWVHWWNHSLLIILVNYWTDFTSKVFKQPK